MGLVHAGPPAELTVALRDAFDIQDFIETGTFLGETAVWAAGIFPRATTIEAAEGLFTRTSQRNRRVTNLKFLHGDSSVELPRVLHDLSGPALLWLDGHWSDGETFGAGKECPLLDELAAVAASPFAHFVFIDDARLFAAPPPAPHDIAQWPTLDAVMSALRPAGRTPYIVYIEDVIVAVPPEARALVAAYCRRASDRAWQERTARPGL